MKNSTFFKIAILIILTGIVYFLSTSKYTFDQRGQVRKNTYFGTVEVRDSDSWIKLPKKPSKLPEGFVLEN